MLSSDFNTEMGALLRRLQDKVRTQPGVRSDDPKDRIEEAIIALVALRLEMEAPKTITMGEAPYGSSGY